ncbi:hypothetical protein BP00DRAFT_412329 [Aspergillus indologenus CBS 114.80]|uniref:Uncharacterized protein n=1 Tax=Aspergillus indologenus CBS 114.80 TaxID=1450541 RepID=A0A2V5JGB9_9EURO|nr:hypothetical protein BP00DRAFT_412329 [Aspergillus indologenus CBS 114.80]
MICAARKPARVGRPRPRRPRKLMAGDRKDRSPRDGLSQLPGPLALASKHKVRTAGCCRAYGAIRSLRKMTQPFQEVPEWPVKLVNATLTSIAPVTARPTGRIMEHRLPALEQGVFPRFRLSRPSPVMAQDSHGLSENARHAIPAVEGRPRCHWCEPAWLQAHTITGCGKQGFPSAQPYLSHTPGDDSEKLGGEQETLKRVTNGRNRVETMRRLE